MLITIDNDDGDDSFFKREYFVRYIDNDRRLIGNN